MYGSTPCAHTFFMDLDYHGSTNDCIYKCLHEFTCFHSVYLHLYQVLKTTVLILCFLFISGKFQIYLTACSNYWVTNLSQVKMAFHKGKLHIVHLIHIVVYLMHAGVFAIFTISFFLPFRSFASLTYFQLHRYTKLEYIMMVSGFVVGDQLCSLIQQQTTTCLFTLVLLLLSNTFVFFLQHKTYVFMSYIYAYAIMDKVLPILSTVQIDCGMAIYGGYYILHNIHQIYFW